MKRKLVIPSIIFAIFLIIALGTPSVVMADPSEGFECEQEDRPQDGPETSVHWVVVEDEEGEDICQPVEANWWTDGPGDMTEWDRHGIAETGDQLTLYVSMWSGDRNFGPQLPLRSGEEAEVELEHRYDRLAVDVTQWPDDDIYIESVDGDYSAQFSQGDIASCGESNNFEGGDFIIGDGEEWCGVENNDTESLDAGERFQISYDVADEEEPVTLGTGTYYGEISQQPQSDREIREWMQNQGYDEEDVINVASTLSASSGTEITYKDPIDEVNGDFVVGPTQAWNSNSHEELSAFVGNDDTSYVPQGWSNLNNENPNTRTDARVRVDPDGEPSQNHYFIKEAYIGEFSVSESVLVYVGDETTDRYIPRDGISRTVVDYQVDDSQPSNIREAETTESDGTRTATWHDIDNVELEWTRVAMLEECETREPDSVDSSNMEDCELSVDEEGNHVHDHDWDFGDEPSAVLNEQSIDYQAKIVVEYTVSEYERDEDEDLLGNNTERTEESQDVYVEFQTENTVVSQAPIDEEDSPYIIPPSDGVNFAQYPDGDIGVHAESSERLWRRINIGSTEYGISNAYRYFNARDSSWDMLTVHSNDSEMEETVASPSHPQQMRAYPAEEEPFSYPPNETISQRYIQSVFTNEPSEDTTIPDFSNTNYSLEDSIGQTGSAAGDGYSDGSEVVFRYDPEGLYSTTNGFETFDEITIVGMLPATPDPNYADPENRIQTRDICSIGECEGTPDPNNNPGIRSIGDANLTAEIIDETEDTIQVEYTLYDETRDVPINTESQQDIDCSFQGMGDPVEDNDNRSIQIVDELGNEIDTGTGGTATIEYDKEFVDKPITATTETANWWENETRHCGPYIGDSTSTDDAPFDLGYSSFFLQVISVGIVFGFLALFFNTLVKITGYQKRFSDLFKEVIIEPIKDVWEFK